MSKKNSQELFNEVQEHRKSLPNFWINKLSKTDNIKVFQLLQKFEATIYSRPIDQKIKYYKALYDAEFKYESEIGKINMLTIKKEALSKIKALEIKPQNKKMNDWKMYEIGEDLGQKVLKNLIIASNDKEDLALISTDNQKVNKFSIQLYKIIKKEDLQKFTNFLKKNRFYDDKTKKLKSIKRKQFANLCHLLKEEGIINSSSKEKSTLLIAQYYDFKLKGTTAKGKYEGSIFENKHKANLLKEYN